MPALGFKSQFAPLVADGSKPHTIREARKVPFKDGDTLQFYTGMRTKACRRLRMPQPCTAAVPIEVNAVRGYVMLGAGSRFYPEGMLKEDHLRELAVRDGFANIEAFFRFFIGSTETGILCGQLIEWRP